MSATNSLHYQLCCEGAKYLLQPRAKEKWQTQNKWATVELVCFGVEECDAWATNGETSTVIEVKVSIQDFRNDKKKYSRTEQAEKTGMTVGNYRYYLVPEEMAEKVLEEMPEAWGLLVWSKNKINRIKTSSYFNANKDWYMFIICSILGREIGLHKVFNYRKTKTK